MKIEAWANLKAMALANHH